MNWDHIQEARAFLENQTNYSPRIGLILGSGLGQLAEELEDNTVIPYKDIPNFPVSTVKGHKGQLVFGCLKKSPILALQGRFHYYEGYDLSRVTFPVRVMQAMGIEKLIVTNAAGGIDRSFSVGGLMLIKDHINFMGANPLRGENDKRLGTRFPDMTYAYDQSLKETAKISAEKHDISLFEGVYIGVPGPSYETPAEIEMFRKLGASAVGMSTVPEVIVANHAGIKVLGISCITNMAAGILDKRLTHEEVEETASRVRGEFQALVKDIASNI